MKTPISYVPSKPNSPPANPDASNATSSPSRGMPTSAELSGWWSSEEASNCGLGLAGALSIRQLLVAAEGSSFFALDEAIGASSSRALADGIDDAGGGADPSAAAAAAAAAAPPDPGTAAGASSCSTMVARLKMRHVMWRTVPHIFLEPKFRPLLSLITHSRDIQDRQIDSFVRCGIYLIHFVCTFVCELSVAEESF